MSIYRQIGDDIFFKQRMIVFVFSIFDEKQRKCQDIKSVLQDNILKVLRTGK